MTKKTNYTEFLKHAKELEQLRCEIQHADTMQDIRTVFNMQDLYYGKKVKL